MSYAGSSFMACERGERNEGWGIDRAACAREAGAGKMGRRAQSAPFPIDFFLQSFVGLKLDFFSDERSVKWRR